MTKVSEAPERLWVQLTPNGSTISYIHDPREVHDNGKPVYQYVRADLADLLAVATERERCALIAEAEGCSEGPDCKNGLMGREHYSWCPMSVAAAIRKTE